MAAFDPAAEGDLSREGGATTTDEQEHAARECARNGDRIGEIRHRVLSTFLDPQNALRYESLGSSLLGVALVEESAACFRSALARNETLLEARHRLGACCQMLGRLEEARDAWAEVVRRAPERGESHSRLAVVRYYLTDYAGAWESLHAAERTDADVPPQLRTLLSARMPEPP
ncbi:MAG: hypothetical protein HZB38_07585 [Planctomycetes bacterium]|nr:hypothetical protein [Planctomycetota bacterium]